MTKKFIIVLCLCIAAIGCTFAGKASFSLQASPFSLEKVSTTSGKYNSTYGYGLGGGFRYNIWDNLTVGADLAIDNYKFDELRYDYLVVSGRAVVGYDYNFTNKLFAQGELGIGISARASRSDKAAANFDLHAYIGGGFRLSDELALTTGCGLDLGLLKGENTKSTDLAFETKMGLLMSL